MPRRWQSTADVLTVDARARAVRALKPRAQHCAAGGDRRRALRAWRSAPDRAPCRRPAGNRAAAAAGGAAVDLAGIAGTRRGSHPVRAAGRARLAVRLRYRDSPHRWANRHRLDWVEGSNESRAEVDSQLPASPVLPQAVRARRYVAVAARIAPPGRHPDRGDRAARGGPRSNPTSPGSARG